MLNLEGLQIDVTLRALKRSDVTRVYELLQDKEIAQYSANISYPYSIRDAENFINKSINPDIEKLVIYDIIFEEEASIKAGLYNDGKYLDTDYLSLFLD